MKKVLILVIFIVFLTACGKKNTEEIVCYLDDEQVILKFEDKIIVSEENIYLHETKEEALDTYHLLGETVKEGSKYVLDNLEVHYYYGDNELSSLKKFSQDKIINEYQKQGYTCN